MTLSRTALKVATTVVGVSFALTLFGAARAATVVEYIDFIEQNEQQIVVQGDLALQDISASVLSMDTLLTAQRVIILDALSRPTLDGLWLAHEELTDESSIDYIRRR
ncbi:MAG: hypothetical protein DHS20C11_37040 [Lysobacteraceae bacterium]|nr:MAG: hypothetical protein DHS20C11_37040 [Xanthomonadaceae bacterium]